MASTWFYPDGKPSIKPASIVEIDNVNFGKLSAKTQEPGRGFKGWIIRAFYYLRYMTWGQLWTLNQLILKHNSFKGKQIPKRSGDVAVITGGARGIGSEIVRKLLIADMHVVIGCRDLTAGWGLIQRLRDEGVKSGTAESLNVDLESFDSVRTFAKRIMLKHPAVHVLINNAGIMMAPWRLTKDGVDSQLQVNYLSHFLLSLLLIPVLSKGGTAHKFSRIINVSSKCQDLGDINMDDILMEKMYSRTHAYNCSKLMQVMSSNCLDRKFQELGLNIHYHSAHPGLVYSELFKHQIFLRVFNPIVKLLLQRLDQGADGIVYAALSPDIENEGGLFLGNCNKASQNKQGINMDVQQALFDFSCDYVKIDRGAFESKTLSFK